MPFTKNSGYEAFIRSKNRLFPKKKTPDFFEMGLDELLKIEEKYLQWKEVCTNPDDLYLKKHIYDTYIKKRIEELKKIPPVRNV